MSSSGTILLPLETFERLRAMAPEKPKPKTAAERKRKQRAKEKIIREILYKAGIRNTRESKRAAMEATAQVRREAKAAIAQRKAELETLKVQAKAARRVEKLESEKRRLEKKEKRRIEREKERQARQARRASGHTDKLSNAPNKSEKGCALHGRQACSLCKPEKAYRSYKYQAERKKHEFLLTYDDFISIVSKPCEYCGEAETPRGIDRWNNSQGYTLQNSNSCCSPCNYLKARFNGSEFLMRCCKIAEHFYASSQKQQEKAA